MKLCILDLYSENSQLSCACVCSPMRMMRDNYYYYCFPQALHLQSTTLGWLGVEKQMLFIRSDIIILYRTADTEPCSGHGDCLSGECSCHPVNPYDPTMKYSGEFCECDNYSCDYYDRQPCGGNVYIPSGHSPDCPIALLFWLLFCLLGCYFDIRNKLLFYQKIIETVLLW